MGVIARGGLALNGGASPPRPGLQLMCTCAVASGRMEVTPPSALWLEGVLGQVGLPDFIGGRGHQGEPAVVEDPFPVLVQPEDADVAPAGLPRLPVDADHGQGREPVLVAVVVESRSERILAGAPRAS